MSFLKMLDEKAKKKIAPNIEVVKVVTPVPKEEKVEDSNDHDDLLKVINIFESIKLNPSKNAKEKIISDNKDNELFVYILEFMYNTYKVTGIAKKKIAKEIKLKKESPIAINSSVRLLIEFILMNNSGADIAIKSVQESIKTFPEEAREFLTEMVTKSYKCGITSSTINKAIPDLIPEFDVMLAEPYSKNKKKLIDGVTIFVVTIKLDGQRCTLIKQGTNLIFKSRQGKDIENLVEIIPDAKQLPDGVYDGELLAVGTFFESKEQYKETMKRLKKKGPVVGVQFVCFDYIKDPADFFKGKCDTPYIERKNQLYEILVEETVDIDGQEISQNIYSNILYHDNLYIGSDLSELKELFESAVTFGEEGLMINIADAPYECKRVKTLLKYKEFQTADLRVIKVLEGDGKNKGTLGAILVEFEHAGNIYTSKVGSGFTDDQRELYYNNQNLLIDKIVEIQYFEISENEDGTYGLRFPVWLNIIREDKTEISMN